MKLVTLVLLVCMMVVTLTGVASAARPVDGKFTIRGFTTSYDFNRLPNGLTSYHLVAKSSNPTPDDRAFCQSNYGMGCEATCRRFLQAPCGVNGIYDGQFVYEEWGTVDFDPTTEDGCGNGTNKGIITIGGSGARTRVVFDGTTTLASVAGQFKANQLPLLRPNLGLDGNGAYTGTGGFVFQVTFTGKFY